MNTTARVVNVARGATPPDTSYTSSYHAIRASLGDVLEFEAARFQGVAATHELYVSSTGLMVYVHAPDSGPVIGLRKWAATERDWPAWKGSGDYPTEQKLYDATLWVLEQSMREVAIETDTEVVYR